MSIEQELVLDASDADRTIAQIDQQLQQAAELFKVALADALSVLSQPIIAPVEADITPAQQEIASLADAPPVDIPVAAETADAEQQILALGDQPPVDIPVTADTAGAESEVSAFEAGIQPVEFQTVANLDASQAAVDAFEAGVASLAIAIQVEADTADANASIADLGTTSETSAGGVDNLEGSVTALGAAAGLAEGSAKELVAAVGELGGESEGAAATGILTLSGATAGFFKEGLNAVSAGQTFNLILGDMKDAAEHIDINGLDTSIQDLGLRFGSTGSEMENATSKLVQFSINSGASKDQAIQFAQQIETLSARAISLNPQLGSLADVTDALGTKIGRGGRFAAQYGLDLNGAEIATRALSDTGKSAASDLTFVEKAMAGAEIASEKYGSTLAGTVAAGEQNAAVQADSLKASFKEAIEQIGVPIVAPVFDILHAGLPEAEQVAQVLGDLARDVLPAVQVALDIIGPPLQVISFVLDQIPGPVVAAAAGFYAFSAALEAVAGALIGEGVALAAVQPEITLLATGLAIAAAAVSFFGGQQADAVKPSEDLVRVLKEEKTAADEAVGAIEAKSLADNASTRSAHDAGVSYDLMNQAIQHGTDDFGGYVRALDAVNTTSDLTGASAKTVHDALIAAGAGSTDFGRSLLALADSGQLSKEQLTTYLQTIERLHNEYGVSAEVAAAEIDSTNQIGGSAKAAALAQQELNDKISAAISISPGLVDAYNAVSGGTFDQTQNLADLAVALGKANLGTTDLDSVAKGLGVTTTQLQGFIKGVTGELDKFVSTAVGKLPDVSSAIDNALDPSKRADKPIIIDPAKLEAELQHSIDAINGFNWNVQSLIDRGFSNLAKVAAERGPEFTQGLVDAIDKGGSDMASTLDAKFGELNNVTAGEPDRLRTAGEGIAVATGDIAAQASQSFGDRFQLAPPTQAQLDQAHLLAELANVPFSEALATVAGQGALAYEQALGVLPGITATATQGATGEIDGWAHAFAASTGAAGTDASGQFGTGIDPLSAAAGAAVKGASTEIGNATGPLVTYAFTSGVLVGAAFDDGISAGIDKYVWEIEQSARDAVSKAQTAAKKQAGISSPSKMFMKIGGQIAQGLALGIEEDTYLVAKASESMVAAIENSYLDAKNASAAAVSIAAPASAELAGGFGSGYRPPSSFTSDVPSSIFRDIIVHVDGSTSEAQGRRVGSAVGGAIVDRLSPLAGRRLVVATKVG